MTGWEMPDFAECLFSEPKGEISGMEKFLEEYPLAAISADKKHFVVIRDFECHITDGRISLLYARGEGELSHKGITIWTVIGKGGNETRAIIPNNLHYKEVRLEGTNIHIYFGKEKKTTNFQEICRALSGDNLTEDEIVKAFYSFENKFEELEKRIPIEKQTVGSIETDFFGILNYDDKSDNYIGGFAFEGMSVQVRVTNIYKEQFDKNITIARKTLTKFTELQNSMVDQMLKLKNETWVQAEENKLDRKNFLKEIKLYSITVFEDGSINLWYKAGSLFWGHEIMTFVETDGTPSKSTIVG